MPALLPSHAQSARRNGEVEVQYQMYTFAKSTESRAATEVTRMSKGFCCAALYQLGTCSSHRDHASTSLVHQRVLDPGGRVLTSLCAVPRLLQASICFASSFSVFLYA